MARIAVVACFDTKYHEVQFMKSTIESFGHTPFLIDISTGSNPPEVQIYPDVTKEEVLAAGGCVSLAGMDKGTCIKTMAECAAALLEKLYKEEAFDGILGMGGLQNTVICSSALRTLPIGFPKVICSTIASGSRTFDTIVGDKDIAVLPSIVDFAGINPISETVLTNSLAMLVGMIEHGRRKIETGGQAYIGATLMGITNDTVMRAVNRLTAAGKNVISFHSTGIGGRVLESLIREGVITGVMDMCLHEMTAEYFGGRGYSKGADHRLTAAAEMGIPALIVPGGIDFACLSKEDFFDDEEQRGYVWHTKDYLTHTRLWEREILDITRIIVERVNRSVGPVKVILPMGGLRTMSRTGEFFNKPETIQKMKGIFETELRRDIDFMAVDMNFDDPHFGDTCSSEMLALLEKGKNA